MKHPIFLKYIDLISRHGEMESVEKEFAYLVASLVNISVFSFVYWHELAEAIGDPDIDYNTCALVADDGWEVSPSLHQWMKEIVGGKLSFEGKELEDYL